MAGIASNGLSCVLGLWRSTLEALRCCGNSQWRHQRSTIIRVKATAPTFLVFFKENARCRNPATSLRFTFTVFSQVQCVLGSQVSVNSHVMLPAPAGSRFFPQGKNAPRRNHQEVSKLEERHMLTKEFSHVCVCRKEKKSDAAASAWAKDPQAPKKINFQEKICGNGG